MQNDDQVIFCNPCLGATTGLLSPIIIRSEYGKLDPINP